MPGLHATCRLKGASPGSVAPPHRKDLSRSSQSKFTPPDFEMALTNLKLSAEH